MKNLFIVESPLQLINCIEAKSHFHIKEEDALLIIINKNGVENFKQINNTLKIFPWKNYVTLPNKDLNSRNKQQLLNFPLPQKIKKQIKSIFKDVTIENLFFGDNTSRILKSIVNSLHFKKAYLVDDGNMTLSTIRNLCSGELKSKSFFNKKDFFYTVFGGNLSDIKPSFFTCYYQEFGTIQLPNIEVVKNEMWVVKKMINAKTVKNRIYFLGVKIVEIGEVSINSYINNLKQALSLLRSQYPDSDILYIPHRGEDDRKLIKIERQLQLEVLKTGLPIEVFLINSNYLPTHLATFFSSALDTCSSLFEDKINLISFVYPGSEFSLAFRSNVSKVYQNYRDKGIVVKEIY